MRKQFQAPNVLPAALGLFFCASLAINSLAAAEPSLGSGPYARWKNGPSTTENFFPIAVWLQSPARAKQYHDAGFNTYVALWRGPNEEQLRLLKEAGMRVICHQNEFGLKHLGDPTIVGWMHGDEPDNAQSLGSGKGYGPPIAPEKIVADYQRIKAADPSRPVMLNLGQGVAWDGWYGRGVRSRHPEDYPEYIKGCDIASFDIYPVAHDSPEVLGKLWLVAHGVERLNQWKAENQIAWNCIECTRIHNPNQKATPQLLRSEIWMSLIHGSNGIIYFVHEWQPKFKEAALLDDPEMLTAATTINRQIAELAPVLNSPAVEPGAMAKSNPPQTPIATRLIRKDGSTYVFCAAMREGETEASIQIPNLIGEAAIEVIGENRKLDATNGSFHDRFKTWDVHLYLIRGGKKPSGR